MGCVPKLLSMTLRVSLLGGVVALVATTGLGSRSFAQSWVQIQPDGGPPPGRMNNTAVFDPNSGELIIFGGFKTLTSPVVETNDVWVLTNANRKGGRRAWIQLHPTGDVPPPLAAASAVYDPYKNVMIVFGGQIMNSSGSQQSISSTWLLTNANGTGATRPNWKALGDMEVTPTPRQNHQAVYDPVSNSMIVFGGLNSQPNPNPLLPNTLSLPSDVWVLENATPTTPPSTPTWESGATIPSPRQGFAAVYDGTSIFVLGGCTAAEFGCSTPSSDYLVLSNPFSNAERSPFWSPPQPIQGGPAGMWQFSSVAYLPTTKSIVVFGGRQPDPPPPGAVATFFGAFTQQTWMLNNLYGGAPYWTEISAGSPPSPRGQSVPPVLYDPSTARMMVFGGPTSNDTFTLNVGP